jgi:hypothetical protein
MSNVQQSTTVKMPITPWQHSGLNFFKILGFAKVTTVCQSNNASHDFQILSVQMLNLRIII